MSERHPRARSPTRGKLKNGKMTALVEKEDGNNALFYRRPAALQENCTCHKIISLINPGGLNERQ